MATIRNYAFPETPEEAYALLTSSKSNAVIGGNSWLHLTGRRIDTAIDLSRLSLDCIARPEDGLVIGAYVTLRDLETKLPGTLLSECVKPIVGVQFRNMATVGGSLYSRFGFSDVLTAFLSADASVRFFNKGNVPIADFSQSFGERDVLLDCKIENNGRVAAMETFRNTETDLPVLTVCVSVLHDDWRVVIGARPGRAKLAPEAGRLLSNGASPQAAAKAAAAELSFGSDMRASGTYRAALAETLTERAIERILSGKGVPVC